MDNIDDPATTSGNWWRDVFRPKSRVLLLSLAALAAISLMVLFGTHGKGNAVVAEIGDKVLFDTGLSQISEESISLAEGKLPESNYVLVPKFANSQQVLSQEVGAFNTLKQSFDHYREELQDVANGQLPKEGLCKLPWTNKSVLRCDAEFSFELLDQAFKAEFGHDIDITDSYRDFETQVDVRNELGKIAAVPGYSNHGNGIALDLGSNIPDPNSKEHKWMVENAGKFHWINPDWAKTTKIEPWHWEYHYEPPAEAE